MASAESHVGAAREIDHTPPSAQLDRALLKVAAAVIAGSIMAILDTTVVTIALQSLIVQFHTSFDTVQWVTTAYMLALATVIPATGWAAERFGTKRLYAFALTLFLVGSVLAGLAWDIGSMIVFRVLQGLGGGILPPARHDHPDQGGGTRQDRSGHVPAGRTDAARPLAGPIIGGWLVESVSWRWIFYLNVPIGLLALVLTLRYLPRDSKQAKSTFDLPGMLMLSPGVALLLYGISTIPRSGGVTPGVWAPVGLGLLLVVSFVVRANRIEHPLLDLGLFRNRDFCVAIATMAVFAVAFFGVMIVLPTYFLMVHAARRSGSGRAAAAARSGSRGDDADVGATGRPDRPGQSGRSRAAADLGRTRDLHPGGSRRPVLDHARSRALSHRPRRRCNDDADHHVGAAAPERTCRGAWFDHGQHHPASLRRRRFSRHGDRAGGRSCPPVRRAGQPRPVGGHHGPGRSGATSTAHSTWSRALSR